MAYFWYEATNEVYREVNKEVRYRDAEDKASKLKTVLSGTQLKNAERALIQLYVSANKQHQEYLEKLNTYIQEESNQ